VRRPAVLRSAEAEKLTAGGSTLHLLLDASSTGGALSSHRVRLRNGAIGATPHRHRLSSELFYVLDGEVDLLAGDRVLSANTGDLVVVPPGSPHAFAATAGTDAELLVVVTPGVERFDFFRLVAAVLSGDAPSARLSVDLERFDIQDAVSPSWEQHRARDVTSTPRREMGHP
jgi:quercetin dioxygenase-like cupin family protein